MLWQNRFGELQAIGKDIKDLDHEGAFVIEPLLELNPGSKSSLTDKVLNAVQQQTTLSK